VQTVPNLGDINHPWILERVPERDRRDWIEMTFIARTADSPLAAMRAMSRMTQLLNAYIDAAVSEARERGASWADIAEALGRSKQAIHKQYGRSQ
jgi:hypothetical protein